MGTPNVLFGPQKANLDPENVSACKKDVFPAAFLLILMVMLGLGSPSFARVHFCPAQNLFVTQLANSGVQMHLLPKSATTSICSSQWKKAGTCCDAASLEKFQMSQEQGFHNTISRAQIQFQEAASILQQGLRNFERLRDVATKFDPRHPIIGDLDKFTQFVTHGLNHVGANTQEDLECLALTHGMRRESLCYACAGDSNRFFTGGKARMSLHHCKAVISSCASTWLKLIMLVQGLGTAERIVNTIKSYFPAELAAVKMSLALPIKLWIEASNLLPNLKKLHGKLSRALRLRRGPRCL